MPAPAESRRLAGAARARFWIERLLLLCIPLVPLVYLLRFALTWNLRWLDRVIAPGAPATGEQRRAMLVLGVLLALIMLVPFANLLLPGLMCASVCHLRVRAGPPMLPMASPLP